MNTGKFVDLLTDAYRQIFFEQEMPPGPPAPMPPPLGGPIADPAAMPPMGAMPGGNEGDKVSDLEKPTKSEGPIKQEGESFLVDLLAKAIFIDIEDEEKFRIKNMQEKLNDENVHEIELEALKRINADSYKIIDIDENLFELSPKQSRIFLQKISQDKIIESPTTVSGGGEVYLVNLILTVLLRDFDLKKKSRVIEILEDLKETREKKTELKEESNKTLQMLQAEHKKYVKV